MIVASIAMHKLYEKNFSDYFLIMIYDYCVFMRFYNPKFFLRDSRENRVKTESLLWPQYNISQI